MLQTPFNGKACLPTPVLFSNAHPCEKPAFDSWFFEMAHQGSRFNINSP
jgi:hypothetical protein